MSDDRLFELVKSDPKSFDKLLGATLSSRDFFDFNLIRNSPKAKLSRKFDNLVAQLAEERNHDLLAKALVHETPARDITFSDIIDQTMFFPVKELFSKFVEQTGLPALFQSPHQRFSFINAYSEGYRRNPVKQRLFGIS